MKKFSITLIAVLMLLATTLYAEHGNKDPEGHAHHAVDKDDTDTSNGDGCCGKAKTCKKKDAKTGCPEKASKEGKTCPKKNKSCSIEHSKKCDKTTAKTCKKKDARHRCSEKSIKESEECAKASKTCSIEHSKKCDKSAKKTKPQTTCPVMGSKINKKIYTDYQGQRVYFCCPMCKGPFAKDPEKYFKKIAESKVVLKSVQKKCTVTGKPIDRKNYVDYKGRRVYFCTSECQISFKEKPKKHLEKLNRQSKGKG